MLLYHLLNAKYGLAALRDRRLKISRLMELNDPFEFLGPDLGDRTFRSALLETKRQLSKTRGIICFSKSWRNPVLWSHYADRHRGVSLGFDVDAAIVQEVTYVSERFALPSQLDASFMNRILFTKFEHWKYEREYRAFVSLDEHENGLYFKEFSEQLKLVLVIVGAESTISRAAIASEIRDDPVRVFKARAAFRAFQIVRNRDESMWT